MNFYQQQHAFYCGVDLHAGTLYLCILSQQGDKVLHREVVAEPAAFLEAVAPYRAGLVVACECMFASDRARRHEQEGVLTRSAEFFSVRLRDPTRLSPIRPRFFY